MRVPPECNTTTQRATATATTLESPTTRAGLASWYVPVQVPSLTDFLTVRPSLWFGFEKAR